MWLHGLSSPWNSPGQNTAVGSFSHLQGIFPTQQSNQGLLHCRQILYQLSYQGSPSYTHIDILFWVFFPLWFITGDWIWSPVLYSRTLLLIYPIVYKIVCIFWSQALTPCLSPPCSPLATTSLFLGLSLCFCCINTHWCHILDSTYKWYHMVFVFLTSFTEYDNLWLHPCCCRWHCFVLFYGRVVFRCTYVPHLFDSFICCWTFRLLPCLGSWEQCCYEHRGACVFLN